MRRNRPYFALTLAAALVMVPGAGRAQSAELVVRNARITTLNPALPNASALAVRDGRIVAVGDESAIRSHVGPATRVIDAGGRRVLPGLNDSHLHLIRGGLNYTLELRWDGVSSLARALEMLRAQAGRTPAGEWVRVVGGWSDFQFSEGRGPTLEEINAAAPDVPVFVLHLYSHAMLNRAALRALGITQNSPAPRSGVIERDAAGEPTGLLIGRPDALILYSTLARMPKLNREEQLNSSRHFMRELNRLGVTSAIDPGGGGQNFPDDYNVIEELARQRQLTVRVAFDLMPQRPGQELADYVRWTTELAPGRSVHGAPVEDYHLHGAGEALLLEAVDFENFLEPRPELPPTMEANLRPIVERLVEQRWPFRIHGTYRESVMRFLDVFEAVNRARPLAPLRWFVDHGETLSDAELLRIKALGGGIAIQGRTAMQGEDFRDRYGKAAAATAPPLRRMLQLGIPVGLGTDGTRVSSYNPWVTIYWATSGRTLGGWQQLPPSNRLTRLEALRLFAQGSAWLSSEESTKGTLAPGYLADFVIYDRDPLNVPDIELLRMESVVTVMGGRIVFAQGTFRSINPPLPAPLPSWSPVAAFGGYGARGPGH